jgi:hypothetical protein
MVGSCEHGSKPCLVFAYVDSIDIMNEDKSKGVVLSLPFICLTYGEQ